MTNIWLELGFRESPYATSPIPATAEGKALLVGRRDELATLESYLSSTSLHPTLEGENGVGKTSLTAVAGYELRRAFETGRTSQALLPIPKAFQLTGEVNTQDFRRRVLLDVAHAFIADHDILRSGGFDVPDVRDMRKWLTKAVLRQGGGGISGVTVSRGSSSNTSSGFSDSGFSAEVENWLRQCFPTEQAGGFICTLDNLELLERSQTARVLLESMRDEVFALPGLRWILCGSRGIVRSVASSSRLQGRLLEPMELGPLGKRHVTEVVQKRVEHYRISPDAIAPVRREGFGLLFAILGSNLRNALKYAEEFSFWMWRNYEAIPREERAELLLTWLAEVADKHVEDTRIGGAAWHVFDQLVARGGSCSPSDHEDFGYSSPMAMRPQIKALEETNLVASVLDEADRRRKTITVTPRGWLVDYARRGYTPPQ